MAHTADILAVQSRLQDLLETMPPAQAMLLEAVVAGTPIEVQPDAADTSPDADDRAIIIVSDRGPSPAVRPTVRKRIRLRRSRIPVG